MNPCDSQLQNQKYDMGNVNYGNSDSKLKFEPKPGLLGSKGDLSAQALARSAEKQHQNKVNYPLI